MDIKIFDSINRNQLSDLLKQQADWNLSLYMPTAVKGQDTRKNPILYKNLTKQVLDKLQNPAIKTQLEEITFEHDFWQNQNQGLAVLMNPHQGNIFRLPLSFDQSANLGRHFFVRPLLPYINQNGSFLLLTLDQKDIRLLVASHYSPPEEIPLPTDLPRSLQSYLDDFDYEGEIQFRQSTSEAGKSIFHGHGDVEGSLKKVAKRFFALLDEQLNTLFNEYNLPLVLVATQRVQQLYRAANTYHLLEKQGIEQHARTTSLEKMQQKGWEIVSSHYLSKQSKQQEKLRELANSDQKSHKLEDIIKDAYQGKVEALFVDPTAHVWGEFKPQQNMVEVHDQKTPNSQDLLELAVHWTILRGGNVYITQNERDKKFGITAWRRY